MASFNLRDLPEIPPTDGCTTTIYACNGQYYRVARLCNILGACSIFCNNCKQPAELRFDVTSIGVNQSIITYVLDCASCKTATKYMLNRDDPVLCRVFSPQHIDIIETALKAKKK